MRGPGVKHIPGTRGFRGQYGAVAAERVERALGKARADAGSALGAARRLGLSRSGVDGALSGSRPVTEAIARALILAGYLELGDVPGLTEKGAA